MIESTLRSRTWPYLFKINWIVLLWIDTGVFIVWWMLNVLMLEKTTSGTIGFLTVIYFADMVSLNFLRGFSYFRLLYVGLVSNFVGKFSLDSCLSFRSFTSSFVIKDHLSLFYAINCLRLSAICEVFWHIVENYWKKR